MPVFGLTGDWGSGKTTILKILKRKGAEILSLDDLVHSAYKDKNSPIFKEVKREFPQVVKGERISSKRLGKIVFEDKKKLERLEKIVHPWVIKELKRWVRKSKKEKIYIAEVPLLFEKKLDNIFDAIIFVYTPRKILMERLKRKTNFSSSLIRKRLSLFLPPQKKKRLSDFVLRNDSNLDCLREKAERLWSILSHFSKIKKQIVL